MNINFVLPLTLIACLGNALMLLAAEPQKHDPTRWESTIEKFEAQDKASPPPTGGALFIGSSSIRKWNLDKTFPDRKDTINRGFGGSQMADSAHYADRIAIPYKPRVIVVYAGDNDIAAGKSPQTVLADYQAFVKKIHAALPNTRIVYIAIKPSIALGAGRQSTGGEQADSRGDRRR